MDNNNRKEKLAGVVGTLLLHIIVCLVLWLGFIQASEQQAESGVPVLLGTELLAQGEGDRYKMTEVDVLPDAKEISASPEKNISQVGEEILSQELEETVAIEHKEEDIKNPEVAPKKPADAPIEKPKEKTEAELRAEAEKAAAEAAAKKIAGAFGKGSDMANRGEAEAASGIQGSSEGNSETGKPSGESGYGTFDLGGRGLVGDLPKPDYRVQDEGRVVVTIVVNPSGQVVGAEIHRRTNTVNPALRKAALDAARKARFSTTDGVDNQSGTITYYFKLK